MLGLGHSDDPADVMSPYYRPDRVALSAADVKRVEEAIAAAKHHVAIRESQNEAFSPRRDVTGSEAGAASAAKKSGLCALL